LHEKEKAIHDFQQKMTEQTHEIGRLNTAVEQARSELTQERSRRASAIEETVQAQTSQFQQTKHKLEHQITDLQHSNQAQLAQAQKQKVQSEDTITELKDQSSKLQQDIFTLETRMRQEMTTTKELTDMLSQLRKSMKYDSESELKKLDELEQEIKTRSTIVEETVQISRGRMDSGTFLDQSQQQHQHQQAQH